MQITDCVFPQHAHTRLPPGKIRQQVAGMWPYFWGNSHIAVPTLSPTCPGSRAPGPFGSLHLGVRHSHLMTSAQLELTEDNYICAKTEPKKEITTFPQNSKFELDQRAMNMKSFPQVLSEFGSEKTVGAACQTHIYGGWLLHFYILQKQSQVESHHCLTNFLKKSFLRNMKETRNMRKWGIWALHIPSPPTSITG